MRFVANRTKRKISIWITGLVLLAPAAAIYWLTTHQHRPKYVLIAAFEKTVDGDDIRKEVYATMDKSFDAEMEIQAWMADKQPCMVPTHNKDKADFLVYIYVTRYQPAFQMGSFSAQRGVELWGEARMSLLKGNGDLVRDESFLQGNQVKGDDDIGQQPLKRAWQILCSSPAPF